MPSHAALLPAPSSTTFSRKSRLKTPRHINTRMTTHRKMEMAYTIQQKVITGLRNIGDSDLADRLQRCMTARQQRHYGDGWPYSCRSSACLWCRRAMIRGWWEGMRYWAETATTATLAIISIRSPEGLPDAVRRLRRGLRDSVTARRDALDDGVRSASPE